MHYILLTAGIALIIYAALGWKKGESIIEAEAPIQKETSNSFEQVFINSEILQRLNDIEEKLDSLSTRIEKPHSWDAVSAVESHKTQLNITHEDIGDKNKQIQRLEREGKSIEEIADTLGITKGEVLLRLGMKK